MYIILILFSVYYNLFTLILHSIVSCVRVTQRFELLKKDREHFFSVNAKQLYLIIISNRSFGRENNVANI